MNRAEEKAQRLLQIERLLWAHPEGLTRAEIARALGVNRSTITKYLNADQLPPGIYEDDRDGNRLKMDPDASLTRASFTLHEIMAVHLATRLLATRTDKQNPHAASALRKLGVALQRLDHNVSQHLLRSADVMDESAAFRDPVYLHVLETLTSGWSAGRKVQISHQKADGRINDGLFSPYFIEPYAVGQTAHVIGWRELADGSGAALRTLKIERIRSAHITHERYEIPADFDAGKLLRDAWGIWYSDEEPVEVVLRFHPKVALRVKETRWHPSQQVEDAADGYLIWRAKIAEPQEMLNWVRGWGADCEVVGPPALRANLASEAQRLAALYGVKGFMTDKNEPFLAHSKNNLGKTETVMEHVQRVAELAEAFTAVWGSSCEGQVAGLLHDLGKYGELFKGVLAGTERKIDHSTPGAHAVLRRYGLNGIAAALAIQGHHGGLQSANIGELKASLRMDKPGKDGRRYASIDVAALIARYEADGGVWPPVGDSRLAKQGEAKLYEAAMLDARMLFSALVDADYLATAAHFDEGPDGYHVREGGQALEPKRGLKLLNAYIRGVQDEATKRGASAEMLALRNDLMQACLDAAALPPGLFTLTAPTGAGKTLAMMGFALKHALAHGLHRIVVVLPYLSIIDQSAQVYESVFAEMPPGYVLQDHSLADEPGGYEDQTRLAAQNWDAPIIVTTTVRFFESLFANRPGDCRKLHRLARSVIMFDEAQTMPVGLVVPTLAALSHLQSSYGASVLFSTATQPALETAYARAENEKRRSVAGWRPKEVVGDELRLFDRARRVRVVWPQKTTDWETLADIIAAEQQALVIANLRRHAADLFRTVQTAAPEGTYHLSTNMCPAHRLQVLGVVKERLREELPCRLISTQCVEAGVDIDFPAVWRALAPLDAIAQAAGRCNREGKLAAGTVHVFRPPDERILYPSNDYEHAAVTLSGMLKGQPELDLLDPNVVQEYFRRYYEVDKPERKISRELGEAITALDFKLTAEKYRWIDGAGANVLVAYAPQGDAFKRLKEQVRAEGITARWLREARPLAVGVRTKRSLLDICEEVKTRDGESSGWYILLQDSAYDENTGLKMDEAPSDSRYLS